MDCDNAVAHRVTRGYGLNPIAIKLQMAARLKAMERGNRNVFHEAGQVCCRESGLRISQEYPYELKTLIQQDRVENAWGLMLARHCQFGVGHHQIGHCFAALAKCDSSQSPEEWSIVNATARNLFV